MSGIMNMLLGARTAIAVAVDEFFNRVTLLLPGDGTNGAQNNTFLDSSTNNFTITRNGNTTQGTFSPFSQTGWSNYFDGSGDYLTGSAPLVQTTSTSTFTFEGWIYPTTFANVIYPFGDMDPTGGTFAIGIQITTGGIPQLYWFDGAGKTCSGAAMVLNQWNYFAFVVNANAITAYVNSATASQSGTTTLTNRTQTNNFAIGQWNNSTTPNAYISNLRFSTVARTISAVPTAPFTADANTRLLTCQSNRFVDNSTNAFTITRNGDVSVQPFSPFLPTIPYSAATVGGSGFFDGTGDYLQTPSITIGTNSFCFECWIYPTTTQQVIAGLFYAVTNNGLQLSYYGTGGSNTGLGIAQKGVAWQITSSGLPVLNQWNHVAFVRSGTGTNQTSIFLNGVRVANGTVSYSYAASTYNFGYNTGDNAYFTGYMSGARLTNGSTPYDATLTTLTIPTAPPTTSASNTTLLLNYTNAGITDATAKNVLETVGNAQISTTQSKFGGSSMYFDGTGDYLRVPYSKQWALGGDFTIEFWINYSAHGNYGGIVSCANSNTGSPPSAGWAVVFYATTNNLYFEGQGGFNIQSSSSISTNTWTHCAVVRSGSTITMYIGGTSVGSGTSSTVFDSTSDPLLIGIERGFSGTMTGYIDDLRISRYARYTSAFTPPTAAFPLQ
jgi:hypothetical protein